MIHADVLLNACKDIGLAVNTGKTKYMDIGCRGIQLNGTTVKPENKGNSKFYSLK